MNDTVPSESSEQAKECAAYAWKRRRRLDCALLSITGFVAVALAPALRGEAAFASKEYDVVVYGGTSAAVTAALQAEKMGRSVVIVSPDKHLGGLTTGGLGWTDSGNKKVIGGLAREFYHRLWKHYQRPEAWQGQAPAEYVALLRSSSIDDATQTMWTFEPRVAEQIIEHWVAEHKIPVVREAWLDRTAGVKKEGERIVSIATLDGQTFRGRMFIDATYEGDLLAAAGATFTTGREANSRYGETLNGVQVGVLHHRHHFGCLDRPVDPYVVPGDPQSGLLPRISGDPPGEFGQADDRIQAYCFRLCLTDNPQNRIPFEKPADYDPAQYELLARIYEAGWDETFEKFDPVPNRKIDVNNHGPFSSDNIGFNYDYPNASYERRREIIAEHENYQKGLLYFIATDSRVPVEVRDAMSRWGLARDEFVDNGHWPHQLYIREARRMVGDYIMTENDLLKRRETPHSVGMGSYAMDSHNVQRYVTPEGFVQNEGDIGASTKGPYRIAYGAITPQRGECENLLVPTCVSSSHIAYGSIRMEPVFMILGQSAATAAALALEDDVAVQDLDYDKLQSRLKADGQVLE